MSSCGCDPGSKCCAPSAERAAAPLELVTSVTPPANAPGDFVAMIALPGGEFLMGTESEEAFAADGERPVRRVMLSPFSIGTYPVTNREFAAFVTATGYRTEAEIFGWSFVFWSHIPADRFHELVKDIAAAAPWWCVVPGAYWKAPVGSGSDVSIRGDHPAVHVTWSDAQAFCAWSGNRLPSEAEWEYAARGGLVQKLYPWGDELHPNGEHRANIWQGDFPHHDTAGDGYAGTCPVDAFPPNPFGIYSIAGNAWEWTQDWFGVEHSPVAQNPTGPATGTARVMKGGSFLCHASYCNRYRVAARSSNTPDSSASNLGFRCAR